VDDDSCGPTAFEHVQQLITNGRVDHTRQLQSRELRAEQFGMLRALLSELWDLPHNKPRESVDVAGKKGPKKKVSTGGK
jgi:hypothetical protein